MIDGEGVFVAAHVISTPGVNEPVVGVSWVAAACHHSVGAVSRLIRIGGGGLFLIFLFFEFIGALLEVAIVTGMSLAGTVPALDIRIRGVGRPRIVVVRGFVAFIALSALLRDGECP